MDLRPDAETALIQALRTRQVDACGKMDDIGRRRRIVVRGTGGDLLDPRRSGHQVTFTAWGRDAQDDLAAHHLAHQALAHLEEMDHEGWIGEFPCHRLQVLSLPYQDPDPHSGVARYSFTVRVTLARKVK